MRSSSLILDLNYEKSKGAERTMRASRCTGRKSMELMMNYGIEFVD